MPARAFVSYARDDRAHVDLFLKHAAPLVDRGDLEIWSDQAITPGETWDDSIRERLEEADIVLLFISADALASSYIKTVELKRAPGSGSAYRHGCVSSPQVKSPRIPSITIAKIQR